MEYLDSLSFQVKQNNLINNNYKLWLINSWSCIGTIYLSIIGGIVGMGIGRLIGTRFKSKMVSYFFKKIKILINLPKINHLLNKSD